MFVEGVWSQQPVGAPPPECSDSDDDFAGEAEEIMVGQVPVPLPAAPAAHQQHTVPQHQTVPGAAPRPPAAAHTPHVQTPLRTPGRPVSNRSLFDSPSAGSLNFKEPEIVIPSAPPEGQHKRHAKHAHLEPRYSSRPHKPPDTYVPEDFRHPKSHLTYCLAANTVLYEPSTYEDALSCPDAEHWHAAIQSELASLYENNTWTIDSLPADRKQVGSKWVFKIKLKADGSIARYKAKVVAKGYSQIPGVDYNDTFSPVVKLTTLRMFVALAAVNNLELEQLDVTTAFLYGNLQEEIFMQVPPGVPIPAGTPRPVCRLQKTLYGLKQSPRAWFERIDTYLQELGYASLHADSNAYVKQEGTNFLALAIYVDDIILLSSSMRMIYELKEQLRRTFKITEAGALAYCLGMQLLRNRTAGTIFLHQHKYALQILARYGMSECRPIATPVEQNVKYT